MGRNNNKTADKLRDLTGVLSGKSSMLIGLQNNPDPDALASAMALRKLANGMDVQCSLACEGSVARAENRALVRYTGLNLRPMRELDLARFDLIALVDTQPGQKNNSLPEDVRPDIVIDHHPVRPETRGAAFTDVRSRYGATSTILYEYLQAAKIVPDAPLATALLYGIRSDTQDFGREATRADMDAFGALYPLANKRALGRIQRGQVPPEYFTALAAGLANMRLCGRSVFSELGDVDNPDMISEIADLLLRHEEADWSLCWGYCGGQVLLSVRTSSAEITADAIIRRVVARKGNGGGHHSMAGGQIPLADGTAAERRRMDKLIRLRFLKSTGNDPAACRKVV